ncbi:hypothetical protein [Thermomonas carbonis]|uniref:Uncharacterized protein n=1 Tax=Thermomonas carbonis TaxID=1463158 RepID=A0A7G9SMK7_9GAMM|nr:hypothetical protein [Thermomonas carbonis]QNN69082.1 hypothetical protein H9L16_10215 [Thermomonas carbonis]
MNSEFRIDGHRAGVWRMIRLVLRTADRFPGHACRLGGLLLPHAFRRADTAPDHRRRAIVDSQRGSRETLGFVHAIAWAFLHRSITNDV